MSYKNKNGVTLVELMIVVVIMGFIFAGLAKLIRNASITWWKSSSQLTLQEEARTAMHYIVQDLQGARASSIGSLGPYESIVGGGNGGLNSGFEFPTGSASPFCWQPISGYVTKVSSAGNPHSGVYCMVVNPNPPPLPLTGQTTGYVSIPFTISNKGNYLLSAWVKTNAATVVPDFVEIGIGQDLVWGSFTPSQSQKFNTSISSPSDPPPWSWIHRIVPLKNLSAGTYRIKLENLQSGTSVYFDDVCLSSATVTMNALSGSTTMVYQLYDGTNFRVRRIKYQPGTGSSGIEARAKLFREQWNGGDISNNANWSKIEPSPLCAYVSAFTVVNDKQESFDITLDLQNEEPAVTLSSVGQRQYQMKSRVSPYLP